MFLQIHDNIYSEYDNARSYFPETYASKIISKESIISRYFLSKAIKKYYNLNTTPLLQNNQFGSPEKYKNLYWSISHKDNLIFIGYSEDEIGIDIERLKIRDVSVLEVHTSKEYTILGGKNWENFYILWTIKESFIKLHHLSLDELKNIQVLRAEKKTQEISQVSFMYQSLIEYNNHQNYTLSGKKGEIFYSIAFKNVHEKT